VARETIDQAVEIGRWQLAHGMSVLLSRHGAETGVPDTRPDLLTLIRTVVVGSGGEWVGIATELLAALNQAAPDHAEIPKIANQLSRFLGEADLAAAGLELIPEGTGRARTFRLRVLPVPGTPGA
jgi:hypothetical protein